MVGWMALSVKLKWLGDFWFILYMTGDGSITSLSSSFRSMTAIFGSFSAEQRCSDGPVRQCWLVELVLLPVVFGKGRDEAQKFSWLVAHEQNIPGGSKGEVAERGMGAGKSSSQDRDWETVAGAREGKSGRTGRCRKPCSEEHGDCSQAAAFSWQTGCELSFPEVKWQRL